MSSSRRCSGTIGFDLDGVVMLNPFASGVFPRIRAFIREHGEGLSGADATAADQLIDERIRNAWRRRMQAGRYVDAYDWNGIFSEVSASFGGPDVPDVSEIVRECCGRDGMIALLAGVHEGLGLLRERGFRMVAITNGYRPFQQPVLDALGIDEYFDAVYTPDVSGFAKPDPRAFEAVPDLVAHVGDTLMHDVLGANLAGLLAVLVDPAMPPALSPLMPRERVRSAEGERYLQRTFMEAPYREFHAEATLERCRPFALAANVDEAAQALVEELCGERAGGGDRATIDCVDGGESPVDARPTG